MSKEFQKGGKKPPNSKTYSETFIFSEVVECLHDVTTGIHVCTLDQQEKSVTLTVIEGLTLGYGISARALR